MRDQETAIKVTNLSKDFVLPHFKVSSFKELMVHPFRKRSSSEVQNALDGISFEVQKGDFFGIVGRNGSGKSTMLKLMAGIYAPTAGDIQTNGSLVPFIELGVGFNPELSGRDNVYLNGALLGFNREDMASKYDEIVKFAELERFMDQKLKNYSSGMQVRLAFSIAIQAKADILLLDEVLAVGDEAFQRKCYEYFETLKRNKKTVVLVTHDMGAVEKFCSKALLIEKGVVIEKGDPKLVARRYSDLLNPNSSKNSIEGGMSDEVSNRLGDQYYSYGDVLIEIEDSKKLGSEILIKTKLRCNKKTQKNLVVAYAVKDSVGKVLLGDKSKISALDSFSEGQEMDIDFILQNIMSKGRYFIDLSIYSPSNSTYNDVWMDCASFRLHTEGGSGFKLITPSAVRSSLGKVKRNTVR